MLNAFISPAFFSLSVPVDRSEAQLARANSNAAPVRALQTMIRAVTIDFRKLFATNSTISESATYLPMRCSEWLALSYAHQATNNLKAALDSARQR